MGVYSHLWSCGFTCHMIVIYCNELVASTLYIPWTKMLNLNFLKRKARLQCMQGFHVCLHELCITDFFKLALTHCSYSLVKLCLLLCPHISMYWLDSAINSEPKLHATSYNTDFSMVQLNLLSCTTFIVYARVCTISCGEGWNGQGREGDQKNSLVQLQTPTKGMCLLSVCECTLSVFTSLPHWRLHY